jgi:hypothetical protein
VGHRKATQRGKFTTIGAYIKKTETSQINNLTMHLQLLEKQEQTTSPNQQMERNNKDQG